MQKTIHVCDHCKQAELTEENGFVVHGNLYVFPKGGVVGDNFKSVKPGKEDDYKIYSPDDVGKTEICRECLAKALGLKLAPAFPPGLLHPRGD